jgi:hypothetical protein
VTLDPGDAAAKSAIVTHMHLLTDQSDHGVSPPVMIDNWAEAIIGMRREHSRRKHPSTQEVTWEKDGALGPTDWSL